MKVFDFQADRTFNLDDLRRWWGWLPRRRPPTREELEGNPFTRPIAPDRDIDVPKIER